MTVMSPQPLAFDELVIDFAGRRLLRAGAEQPLEPKAFDVLALLSAAPGQAFTRDQILDAVWGHRHVTPAVLNRIMSLLRHALGEDAQHARYLHTLYGVGYRFNLPPQVPAAGAMPVQGEVTALPTASGAAVAFPAGPASPAIAGYQRRATDRTPAPSQRWRPWLWAAPLLAMLAFAGWRASPDTTPLKPATAAPAPAVARSIAVLPLTNASGDPSQQFFSDGLSENLIATLSRFDGVKVIGRTSAFRFRDSKEDSRTMGHQLGAAYLLDGSVQRADAIVRISARLTRADDGSTVWAEHYDRPYKDLFALQDEIARAVADALHARLVSARDAARQGDRPPSGSIEAYNAYLRGLQHFYAQDFEASVAQQQQATRLDPGYAAAWAQLSIASALIGQDQTDRGKARAAFRTSRAAVDRALALGPDLGIAHGALGNLLFASEFRWTDALAELQRGVALAPDNGPMQGGLSRVLAANGRLGEAIIHRERFLSIEPLAPFNYGLYADLLAAAGRLDEAEENLRIGQQLARSPVPHYRLLYVALLRGDAKTAMAVARQQAPRWREVDIALAAQAGVDRAAADAALERALADARKGGGTPYQIAQVYALRGDAPHAVAWLERAWDARDISLHQLLYDPLILRFRRDPALIAFCAKVGLPPPGESEALSIDQIHAALVATR